MMSQELLNVIDDPQPLLASDERIHIPLIDQGVQVPDQPAGMENESTGAANNKRTPIDGPVPPNDDPTHDGPAPPTTNTRMPSVPPLHRVRARGVFIIGNCAPVKIDGGIEVHLRDGVGGQVDFII